MNDIEMRAQIVKILQGHTTEMEGYSYFSSNPGIPEDRYEEIADEIIAALMLGGPVDLLHQHSAGGVQPEERNVIPSPTLGADEAGAVRVHQVAGGLPRNVQLAEVASEHRAGVRPEGDDQATADHVAHNLKMVAAHPDHSEHSLDMVIPMSGPDGFVLVPVELVKAVEDLSLIYEAGGDIDSKLSEIEAILAARPEVKP